MGATTNRSRHGAVREWRNAESNANWKAMADRRSSVGNRQGGPKGQGNSAQAAVATLWRALAVGLRNTVHPGRDVGSAQSGFSLG